MISDFFAVPVVLFGWGQWSRARFAPILLPLARWGVIRLTIVDRWVIPPAELSALGQEGVLSYLPWEDAGSEAESQWRVAFVVTGADTHASVILRLLEKAPNINLIIVEKPAGVSLVSAQMICDACQRKGVTLLMADHYLLRPAVVYLSANPELMRSIGELVHIRAAINESQSTGPYQHGVIKDLLVHLLDLLAAFFQGARFIADKAFTRRASDNTQTEDETYAFIEGHLLVPEHPPVRTELECGKQLAEDRKEIVFTGSEGILRLDLIANSLTINFNGQGPIKKEVNLQWPSIWSYARLILFALLLSVSSLSAPSRRM